MHRRALAVIDHYAEVDAKEIMRVGVILEDMGKSAFVREKVFPEVCSPDPDDFYGEAMRILQCEPQRSSSFSSLCPVGRACLVRVANLAHYGHITHLEGDERMFSALCESKVARDYPMELELEFLIHAADVAGALGHVNRDYSIIYTKHTHLALEATYAACSKLTEKDAYRCYVAIRAGWLGFGENEHVLTRVGAMLRLFTPEEVRSQIEAQFDVALPGPTPTYVPATLVNFLNQTAVGNNREEKLALAVTVGLPFFAKVFAYYRDKQLSSLRLCFNSIAGVVKENPMVLQDTAFQISSTGNVEIVSQ